MGRLRAVASPAGQPEGPPAAAPAGAAQTPRSLAARFFLPATWLSNRLSYARKFLLLGILALAAIALLAAELMATVGPLVYNAQRERTGIALIGAFSRATELLQQHRGLSSAVLGGSTASAQARRAKEQQAADALLGLERALLPADALAPQFKHIAQLWQRLRSDGLRWERERNFDAHSKLIEHLHLFKMQLAGQAGITQDPDSGTYHLLAVTINDVPTVLEDLARLRGYGAGLLAVKRAGGAELARINTMVATVAGDLERLQHNLVEAAQLNPPLGAALQAAGDAFARSAQPVVEHVNRDIASGRMRDSAEDFYALANVEIDNGYRQLYQVLLPLCETRVLARADSVRQHLLLPLGAAALLLLLAAYCSIGVCRAMLANVRTLTGSAREFAGGALQARVELDTRDEMAQVGDSFNSMASGAAALLEASREHEQRMSVTVETAMDAVVQIDADDTIIGWNGQAERTFGWSRAEAVGRPLCELVIPPRFRAAHRNGMRRLLASGYGPLLNTRVELFGLHRDGHEFPIELSVAQTRAHGKREFSAFIRDISERKRTEQRIQYMAHFDALTGLPNRVQMESRVNGAIAAARRAGTTFALMFLDLDQFKDINDTLGHSIGDALLVSVAARMRAVLRADDMVSRMGGDEFICLLGGVDPQGAVHGAQKLLEAVCGAYHVDGHDITVSCSVGIAMYPHDGANLETLSMNADAAMYLVKQEGRRGVRLFSAEMQQRLARHQRLVEALGHALERGELQIYYQPQLDLQSQRIVGAEALLRWNHPMLGAVAPSEFIPVAEDSGLIVPIGEWVLRQAIGQARRWINAGLPPLVVAVNLSSVQFRHADLPALVGNLLSEQGLPARHLELELTEGVALRDPQGAIAVMDDLHARGVRMSIDDFGTGYSSLSQLKRFKVYKLKIDQSFVRDIGTDPDDRAIVTAIIQMARSLGLHTVAEGVETEDQLRFLRSQGCNEVQGYLFSRPLPVPQFEALLRQQGKSLAPPQ